MKLSEELKWRGFVNQTTFKSMSALDDEKISFYWGVDPSANSMTIGNLAAAMMVRHFIEHGHKAVLLIGGATGMIGDPDGKKEERDLKTIEEINDNKAAIVAQYNQLFNGQEFALVDNYDWFKNMSYLDFLRNVGKHVPLGQMLDRDFVKSRLGVDGNGISYAEFSYSLIQGYDFLHLYRNYGVTLQVAGADQWGNSIAGVDLIRRIEGAEAHVYSVPLMVNKLTGKKFGKTEEGAIWLDPSRTSVYKFYQFWLNVDDEGAADYLKAFTLLDRETIDAVTAEHADNPSARLAQRLLAESVTDIVHGRERRNAVEQVSNVLFGLQDISSLSEDGLDLLAEEISTIPKGSTVIQALVETGNAASNSDARRLLAGGAVSVNSTKISDDQLLSVLSLIKKGKNSFILVR